MIKIRTPGAEDRAEWLRLRRVLWPAYDPATLEQDIDEIASHLYLDSDYSISPAAHAALGYQEVKRCIHFRKDLK